MSWWFTAYVIVISYTCNLIAFLTIPKYPVKLQTAQDLADSYHRVCMLNYGNQTVEALILSHNPALTTIAKKMDMVPLIPTLPYTNSLECLELVAAGTHAMLEADSYIANIVQDAGYADRTYFLKERIHEGPTPFYFRKNTPWKYKFDEGMSRLISSGCIGKWKEDIDQALKRTRYEKKPEGQQALKVEHLQGTFLVLALGLGVALVTFMVERHLGRRESNQ
ncbi:glutamate receptor ionotropic, kainate 1-like [Penaeus indicus]|uniref:glutamate receptor ionotropic, kainate 1-like n=1 Tax=Penaeus indicus TaxID=29960 RepID=UPI00300C206D